MRALPVELAQAEPAVVRPRDFRHVWAQPAKEFRDLARQGALLRLATGYYAVVPEPERRSTWVPAVEAVALAIAQADYGIDGAALMGPSAARLLGAIPRAVGTATVAVIKQRPTLETTSGRVRFVTRDVGRLDRQRTETELGQGWITTPEQTLVDIADRPALGGLTSDDAAEAAETLTEMVEVHLALQLATAQRKRRAHDRIAAARRGIRWHEVLTS